MVSALMIPTPLRYWLKSHGISAVNSLQHLIPAFLPHLALDTLARTQTKIMINGEQLDADPDTFSVVRWMPGSLFTWRDKNGL